MADALGRGCAFGGARLRAPRSKRRPARCWFGARRRRAVGLACVRVRGCARRGRWCGRRLQAEITEQHLHSCKAKAKAKAQPRRSAVAVATGSDELTTRAAMPWAPGHLAPSATSAAATREPAHHTPHPLRRPPAPRPARSQLPTLAVRRGSAAGKSSRHRMRTRKLLIFVELLDVRVEDEDCAVIVRLALAAGRRRLLLPIHRGRGRRARDVGSAPAHSA
eukprot:SAG31_NODE_10855_length_1090_cov_0.872856_2_plen_220_part_01